MSCACYAYAYSQIDDAVTAAREAQPAWARLRAGERAAALKKLDDTLCRLEASIIECISLETGKPTWEAQEEFTLARKNWTELIDMAVIDFDPPTASYRPMGVVAIITPFCLPFASGLQHVGAALLAGNTAVWKPSEKSPGVAYWVAQAVLLAGLPAGTFNLIFGEKEVGRRLIVHEGVSAVFFTGSFETGVRIKQDTLQQHWKSLSLELGAKNPTIIWKDADVESATRGLMLSAFLTAGQRCTSTSRAIVHKEVIDHLTEALVAATQKLTIGSPQSGKLIGPLIDSSAVDRYLKFIGIAQREGAQFMLRGQSIECDRPGFYVSPTISRVSDTSVKAATKSVFQQTELLAPHLAILEIEDRDHALALADATQYGLVASIYTQDRSLVEIAKGRLHFGQIYLNRPTVEPRAGKTWSGLKKSGNHSVGGARAYLRGVDQVSVDNY